MTISELRETDNWLDGNPEFLSETETTMTYKIGHTVVTVEKDGEY